MLDVVPSDSGDDLRCRCSEMAPNDDGVSGALDDGGDRKSRAFDIRLGGPERKPELGSGGESMAGHNDLSLGNARPLACGSRWARIAAASSICTC